MDNMDNLTTQSENALAELGNIGAGNAATALSTMLNTKLVVSPPQVEVFSFDELEQVLGGAESEVVGVISNVEGDLNTMIMFVCGIEDAELLTSLLFGADHQVDWRGEMGLSAIKEIANIIISSYAGSLETLTGMKVRSTQPDICVDMAGSILSVPCIEFGKVGDKALLINSKFYAGEKKLNAYIMAISDVHSYDSMLRGLGIGG